ncbi:MAG: family 43 glycosylhydrolase [Verrucomicrobia bacterium]|nr:family 43 glycosylhydrolase [Verrucomicrobiota bacterium]
MPLLRSDDIQIRDPFILTIPEERYFYLYGTTDLEPWREDFAVGFDTYRSTDLEHWEGPLPAFRPAADFWGKFHFWAPEVHRWQGRFFMFASFKGPSHHRGTQVLVAEHPQGPFRPHSPHAVTPPDCECLDGTLFVAPDGKPWMIFSRDWTQVTVGTYSAVPLADDLSAAIGPALDLFKVNEAPWVLCPPWHAKTGQSPIFVADGAFPFRAHSGELCLLFSSWGTGGYATGIARSASGELHGPWQPDPEPIFSANGGHAMVFPDFSGEIHLTLHQPNDPAPEHPKFFPFPHGRPLR